MHPGHLEALSQDGGDPRPHALCPEGRHGHLLREGVRTRWEDERWQGGGFGSSPPLVLFTWPQACLVPGHGGGGPRVGGVWAACSVFRGGLGVSLLTDALERVLCEGWARRNPFFPHQSRGDAQRVIYYRPLFSAASLTKSRSPRGGWGGGSSPRALAQRPPPERQRLPKADCCPEKRTELFQPELLGLGLGWPRGEGPREWDGSLLSSGRHQPAWFTPTGVWRVFISTRCGEGRRLTPGCTLPALSSEQGRQESGHLPAGGSEGPEPGPTALGDKRVSLGAAESSGIPPHAEGPGLLSRLFLCPRACETDTMGKPGPQGQAPARWGVACLPRS